MLSNSGLRAIIQDEKTNSMTSTYQKIQLHIDETTNRNLNVAIGFENSEHAELIRVQKHSNLGRYSK
jgi:hypothetical protein